MSGIVLAAALFSFLWRQDPAIAAGNEAFQAGKFEDALAAYEKVLAEDPARAEALYDKGNALVQLKRYDDARSTYLQALAGGSEGLAAREYANLGNALASLGKEPEAMESFRRALELEPDNEQARHNLEVLLRRKQKQDEQKKKQQDQQKQDQQQDKQDQQAGQDKQRQDQQNQQAGQDKQDQQQGQGQQDKQNQQAGQDKQDQQQGKDQQQAGQQGDQQKPEQGKQGADAQQAKADQPGDKPDGKQAQAGQPGDKQDPSGKPGVATGKSAKPVTRTEAERVLDSLRNGEKNFQLWRYQKNEGQTDADKDW